MNVQFDKKLTIATANSRKAKKWKNREVLWSALLDRLSRETRTAETMAEYRAMGRDRQADVKDVGGFVGGYCREGRRTDVEFRSLICLDADFASPGFWDAFKEKYSCAACVYSTHKHTPKKPRLRLLIPLDRDADPEEYQAASRRVAEVLGIDQFDDTTYEPQRLMFWPSVSQDGEYVFEYADGPFLSVDALLATYHDWRDVSAWPMSGRVAEVRKREAEKQQDPTSKEGAIGAFCRAWPIEEAIAAFVPDYVPCALPGRYTYAGGSTAAGVVVYDGLFTYSHHATDPASGRLVNAWDLVRLHRFGSLDANSDPDTPVSRLPSTKAMLDFALGDARTSAQLAADRLSEASEDFGAPAPEGEDWKGRLQFSEKGALLQTIGNAVLILMNDEHYEGAFGYDELRNSIVILKDLPWRKAGGSRRNDMVWQDADDSALRYDLERRYGFSSKDKLFDAVNVVAQKRAFHPVRDYLDTLDWDGTPRLDTLLVDYLGAEDTPYVRAVTRKAFTAAVRRIYVPGCKFDYMLTLRGEQGRGKSTLLKILGGPFFSDSFTTLQGKDAYEQVLGVWILEMGELAGLRKAEIETIKMYLSKQSDRFRPAYGRRTQEFPRQCVFIATTNETQFLRDQTGNRRFWVVDLPGRPTRSVWDDLPGLRDQVWAEAVCRHRDGESLYLPQELERDARAVQEEFAEEDPRAGQIAAFLERPRPEGWDFMDVYDRVNWLDSGASGDEPLQYVSTIEIFVEALRGKRDAFDRYAGAAIANIMARMPGWRRAKGAQKMFLNYGKQRFYERVPASEDELL